MPKQPKSPDPMTHGRAVQELCTLLQRDSSGLNPVELFRGLVTACHLALDDLPAHLHYAATGGRESIAAPDSKEKWAQAMDRFRSETVDAFAHGFAILLEAATLPEDPWQTDSGGGPDVIGSVYMDLLSGRSNRWNYAAQFFTPWNVAVMMAKMTAEDLEARFHAEVKAAIAGDPVLEALTLAAALTEQACPRAPESGASPLKGEGFWWWLSKAWPRLKPKLQPVTVCDPCVGSGRLLLAHAACHPLWLSQIGYLQYSGMDIDALCVEMARLNLRLYGITPLGLTAATLEALAKHAEVAGPMVQPYTDVLTAPPDRQEEVKAALIDTVNTARRQQLSLFEEENI